LLPLGIVAPEISPILIVLALLAAIRAFRLRPFPNRFAGLLCVVAAALSAIPLAAVYSTQRKFDAEANSLAAAAPARQVDQVSITRGVVFAEPAGQKLTLDLYRPASDHPLPVVIQIYGGAWRSGVPSDDSRFASTLAREGYLVVGIDYRHAPQFRWPAQLDDVRAAIAWLKANASEHGGDVEHLALVGRSAGAQLALVSAYTGTDQIAAVVSFYGPTDLEGGWRVPPFPDPLPVRPPLEAFLGGTPDEVPRLYEAASPVTYVAKGVPPTLLVYGARDHIVDARFGRDLHSRLKAVGASSILLEIPWAEHAFDVIPGLSYRVTLPYVERFLATYLQ
jgi:acetyl esterase/lipase